jgi:hypothetical protein
MAALDVCNIVSVYDWIVPHSESLITLAANTLMDVYRTVHIKDKIFFAAQLPSILDFREDLLALESESPTRHCSLLDSSQPIWS